MEEKPVETEIEEISSLLIQEEVAEQFNFMKELAKLQTFNINFTNEKVQQGQIRKTILIGTDHIKVGLESKEKDVFCTSSVNDNQNDIDQTEIINFVGKRQSIEEYYQIVKELYEPLEETAVKELKFVILTILLSAKKMYEESIAKLPKAEIFDLPVADKADVNINLYVFSDHQDQLYVNEKNYALGCVEVITSERISPKIFLALIDIPTISKFIEAYNRNPSLEEVKWFIKNKKQFVTRFGNALDFVGMDFSTKKLENFAEDVSIDYQNLTDKEVQEIKFFLKIPTKDSDYKHSIKYRQKLIQLYQDTNCSATMIIISLILVLGFIIIIGVKIADKFLKENKKNSLIKNPSNDE